MSVISIVGIVIFFAFVLYLFINKFDTNQIIVPPKPIDTAQQQRSLLELIIDFNKSLEMIEQSKDFTDYYKIGLHSRKKYARTEALEFKRKVEELLPTGNFEFKNSFKKLIDEV